MSDIDVVFPGVHALNHCTFELKRGEVHALVGENGAGKSTLMKVLTGIYTDYTGDIILDGRKVKFSNIKEAQEEGISIVHQELNLLNYLTVAQNIFIGREAEGFFVNDREINRKTQKLIDDFNINIKPTDKVMSLSVGKLQMVEIARAMSYEHTKILILDEPTAALSEKETEELFDKVRMLKQKGVSVIFISHRMAELRQIADRITIMRDGEYISTVECSECPIEKIIQMMVGRNVEQNIKNKSRVKPDAPVVLEVRNLKSAIVKDVSFNLRKGEILGFAGLVGAGRTEVMRLIFGADAMESGQVFINGEEVKIRSPKDAVRNGIGYLSEDRKRFGLALGLSVRDNVILGSIDKFTTMKLISTKKCDQAVAEYSRNLRIKTPSYRQLIKFLSGGNQQKVIIAKWLMMNTDILIFDEPTRGIDVGAKSEIYDLIDELIRQGKSVIMISSELPEILRMSDRVIVMCEGRKTGELDISQASQEVLMRFATTNEKEGE
ncbi:MAG: sugar ABC transporter ATP-binding protein [Eubacteriales bacterium]|nr:sugar ABC transporter ATP-binding protein [Eubacteriales bacterium]